MACFRDNLWTVPLLKDDALLLFHDSTLVHKAIRLLMVSLDPQGRECAFARGQDSEMSAMVFGALQVLDAEHYLGPLQQPEEYFDQAEAALLTMQINNRIDIQFTVKPPRVDKAF